MNSPYHGLTLISKILKGIGLIGLFLGVISLVVAPLALANTDSFLVQLGLTQVLPGTGLLIGFLTGVLLFFIGAGLGMLLFAVGECFNILVAIETNTRIAAENSTATK
jgi:hypothetical protein